MYSYAVGFGTSISISFSFTCSQEYSIIALYPALDLQALKAPAMRSLADGAFQYSPLANQDEIRVVQLLTERDHPLHAEGPIHCRIEHVLLKNCHLTTEGRCPAKGFDGTWPSPLDKDSAAQPQTRDRGNSNVRWKKRLAERISERIRSSVGPRPASSSCRAEFELQTDYDPSAQAEKARLPWRYAWGGFVALSYVWGDPSVKREIYIGQLQYL